jgi:TRAP-type C4-dicarboxylate transport system permease small subunit
MSRFTNWLKTSIPAVVLVCLWVFLTLLYGTDEAFHDALFKAFNKLSLPTQEFIVGLVVPIAVVISNWKNRPV